MATEPSSVRSTVPTAPFLEDVDEYMKKTENSNPENVVMRFSNMIKKLEFLEQNLLAKKDRLKKAIPDLESNIEMLDYLKGQWNKKEEFEITYSLDHKIYSQARISEGQNVSVWLGANVMLEYPVDEAMALLKKRLENMNTEKDENSLDLDYLKDQITTNQVNLSRVYNWTVKNGRIADSEK